MTISTRSHTERLLDPLQLELPPPDDTVLIQVTDASVFQAAHIPGALLIEPRELVSGMPPAPGKVPAPAQIGALLGGIGYDPAQRFLVYDDEGGGWAGRFIWTLDLIGHRNWAYLDGGLHAWQAAGKPLTSGPPAPRVGGAAEVGFVAGPRAELDEVLARLEDPDTIIWDARSEAEFLGLRSASARAGHMPGAVNLDWLALQDALRDLRLRTDLPELLARHGIHPDKRLITHCQTHHRSGLSYLVARLLGFNQVAAYDGSWSEWGNRSDTPVIVES